MSTKQVLEDALGLLEQGWTKGTYARDIDGNPVTPREPSATSFCVRGAVYCVAGTTSEHLEALGALNDAIPTSIITWNDAPDTTFTDVYTVFRRAIGSRAVSAAEETTLVAA